jgi:hypothetical protein
MEELVLTPEDQTVYDAYMAPDSIVPDLSALSPEGSEAVRAFHSAKNRYCCGLPYCSRAVIR